MGIQARHEETKRVDVSCKLDNLLSREHMSNLTHAAQRGVRGGDSAVAGG